MINKMFKVANIHTFVKMYIFCPAFLGCTLVSAGLGWYINCINDLQLLISNKSVDLALIVYEISWVEYGNVNLTAHHRPNTNFWTGSDQAIENLEPVA